jgi:NADH-quinone oxidoreductase subunit G
MEMKPATVYIDGRAYSVNAEENLLHQCLSRGFDLPYFCWHPALGSVGACRQCAIKEFKDEHDQQGRIVMACMTPASDGARISIHDPEAVAFRASIIEGLMFNHPHDCPVCDEGGECHLQDMTVMTGHNYRRYRFQKRTFRNQYLGPFLNHEMNRCIQCYRCVRFYREYAGGSDFNAFGLRDLVYFGRERDGVLENEFAGNLVEVCPTGVFTDGTLKHHYTRKWDLQLAPSICVHCGLGCNVSIGERYGLLRRVVNRYNGEVNGYFLCDRGRYGYEFVNSEHRIRKPKMRGEQISADAARKRLHELAAPSSHVIGIGSPRASLESNFALRALVGADRFYAGIPESELSLLRLMLDVLRSGPSRTPSLREVESCDAVLILGEDVANIAPRMALSLRQSVRQQSMRLAEKLKIPLWQDHGIREAAEGEKSPLFIAAPHATRLDDIAAGCYRGAPGDVARLGFAVAHALNPQKPEPEGFTADKHELAHRIAAALKEARRPLVIAGSSLRSAAIIQAAASVSRALPGCALSYLTPECNSFGLALMTDRPLEAAFHSNAHAVIIVENDLYRRRPAPTVDAFFQAAERVAVLDCVETPTTARAELLLPSATFADAEGTLVSSEGRAQRFYRAFPPDESIRESWRWLGDWLSLDHLTGELAMAIPELARVVEAAPSAAFRMAGAKIPREPHRYSGRTAVFANIDVNEPPPPDDRDSPLAFSMEGNPEQPPSPLIPFFWSPGWNSIQATNKYQSEIAGPLRGGDPGVRLIEPERTGAEFFTSVPAGFTPRKGEWLLIPLFHIFGTEELTRFAPAVAQLFPQPYLALNSEDAREFGRDAELIGWILPIKSVASLPRGVAGLPVGLPGLEGLELPLWTRISPK